ncbi:hypothetical protein P152DRAFT_180169 [Eremomyces bilateralis CBS 781.70]|uniref:Ubiquitin-conjugating enzyme E2-binding protein n=1 Tax=Eremomyces bilateralis CBS 781.70 TaxID=1392243 RepID=A0A6G1FT92_9PEZI|nr:uncharacterized protein P152DRAFT_180169 [Eremomyces bilateralis CBS 781.70]KAF1808984.1 hypothetical protein P152DRAFT_180169 [Eremomyces bilateralis CBS 781.70]
MTSIALFAEYLLRIRTLSLYISLATSHTEETKATLSADREHVTVTHEGESATIRLPTRIRGGGEAALTLPDVREQGLGSKELTLRLALEEREGEEGQLIPRGDGDAENVVPWDAQSLANVKAIACKGCGNPLLQGTSITSPSSKDGLNDWNDLPSENWAEMMDFWHCHKPDPDHGVGNAGSTKGYAAANKVRAQKSVGLVGLGHLLFHGPDCRGVRIDEQGNNQHLLCESCRSPLGVVDEMAEGFKIFKWAVSVSSPNLTAPFFKTQKWAAATLLHEVETTGVRKYIVKEEDSSAGQERLLVWIFTPDLYFSSSVSSTHRSDPTRAMKVLWQPLRRDAYHAPEYKSTEEMELPTSLYTTLERTLKGSVQLLPRSARDSAPAGWSLGMVERFKHSDIS